MNYNSMAFTPEDVELGLHYDLLNCLLLYNTKAKNKYNDIHITSDGYCTIVEWSNIPYSDEWGGKFEFVDEDEKIMKELHLPDDTYEYVDRFEADEYLNDWLKDNPEYKKDSFGRWYNEKEEQEIKESLERSCE